MLRMHWIGVLEQNETLPEGEKIRVVSVSAAPGSTDMFQNTDLWNAAAARAEEAGVLVLTVEGAATKPDRLMPYPAVLDPNARDDPAACRVGFPGEDGSSVFAKNALALPALTAQQPRNTPPGSSATPTTDKAA